MRGSAIVTAGVLGVSAIGAASSGAVAGTTAGTGAAAMVTSVPAAAAPHRDCTWMDFGQGLVRTSALGSPDRKVGAVPRAGAVEARPVRIGEPVQTLTSAAVGMPAQPNGRFGAAVVGAQVSYPDECADLVVGMPGADAGRGAVVVIPDLGSGFDPSQAVRLPTSALSLQPGDGLGTALGVVQSAQGTLIVAGAPGRDLPAAPNAGALVSWLVPIDWSGASGTPSPPTVPAPGPPVVYVQGAAGLTGHSDPQDRFGSVIATSVSASRVTVGIPNEDVGTATDTGAVARLTFGNGVLTGNDLLWQGHGLPGTAKRGDRLGAAVVDIGYLQAYGIPGKDANGRRDAGSVVVSPPGQSTFRTVTQNTPGMPDRSERGDRFGAALAAGSGIVTQEAATLAIGVPGENTSRTDTGAVLMATWDTPLPLSGARLPVRGLAKGDRFGSSLVVVGDEPDAEEDTIDVLLVGTPGEDRPGARDAGRFYLAARPALSARVTTYANGLTLRERFGR